MSNTMKKSLKDLNLMDRFLFAEAMEDPLILTNMLEIILGKELVLKYLPQSEKEERKSPLTKFIKLDVWAMDMEGNVYDAEAQKEDTKNLPKRSRLYQGIIDSKLLPPGEIDFNKMPNVFVIVIMSFDLFKKGRYRYTFHMGCEEFPELRLEDGATRIFLNTKGIDATGVSSELVELLRYMEATNSETSGKCESERIKSMQAHIETIKSSEEIGVKYMQEWEEKAMERQKALEEGMQKGMQKGLQKGMQKGMQKGQEYKLREQIQKKLEKGKTPTTIAEELEEEFEIIQAIIEAIEKMSEK